MSAKHSKGHLPEIAVFKTYLGSADPTIRVTNSEGISQYFHDGELYNVNPGTYNVTLAYGYHSETYPVVIARHENYAFNIAGFQSETRDEKPRLIIITDPAKVWNFSFGAFSTRIVVCATSTMVLVVAFAVYCAARKRK